MCGISGVLDWRDGPVAPERLRAMAASLVHRGPDEDGFFAAGPVGLAMRRLAIVDVAGGHQPMASADGSVVAIVNGEIYNFSDLRDHLERAGHEFQTKSDCEVVLAGYLEWGDAVLDRLNGIFAIAVWDGRRQRLLLARDRAGVKFLYYRLTPHGLVFGSEVRAIHAAGTERPAVDPVALHLFLRYRYTPSPLSIYAGVRKLAAGTKLVAEAGGVHIDRYWDHDPAPFDPPPTPEAARAELLSRYKEAVRRQLMSDVPIGLLLSGGVDSALLLAMMSEHGSEWPTFTVGYGDGYANDELADAAATARLFGARHSEVRLDRAGFEEDLGARWWTPWRSRSPQRPLWPSTTCRGAPPGT